MKNHLLLFLVITAITGCGNGDMVNSAPAASPLPAPPVTSTIPFSIQRALVFNYRVPDTNEELTDNIKLVTGATYATPQGILNLAYASQNVASGVGEILPLSWFQANHPDWIEYQCDQVTPAWEGNSTNVPIDFSNPTVQQWMVTEWVIPAMAQGYNGIYFDNVWLYNGWSRCGHYTLSGAWVQQYSTDSTDPTYANDTIAWAKTMRTLIHTQAPGFLFGVNYSWNTQIEAASQTEFLQYQDFLLDECGFTACGSHSSNQSAGWVDSLATDSSVLARGGTVLSNNELDTSDTQARVFAFASYLLIASPSTYFAMEGVQQYGVLLDFPEYHIETGAPLDTASQQSDGTWVRHFEKVTVTVNPDNGTATISGVD